MVTLTPLRVLMILGACLAAGGLISIDCKQDGSWDLLNYHFYNAFALLEGRWGRDLWVAGRQTTFNPLLDLPYYIIARWWLPAYPRGVAFLAGLPFGALIALVPLFNATLWGAPWGAVRRPLDHALLWRVAAASLVGLTGTTLTSVIGSTSGDIPTAVLVMIGLIATLASLNRPAQWPRACALAGLAIGLAAGLKLTNLFYAPAMALAVLACAPAGRRGLGAAAFIAAWCMGFLPPTLWWGARLWHVFANPLFPLFNNVFHSPWGVAGAARDIRFLPKSTLQALFYPFYWVSGRTFTVTERALYEPRFALAYIAMAALLARHAWTRRRMPRQIVFLMIFTVGSYIVWEALFSILRYAVVLEILSGSWIILGFSAFLPRPRPFATACILALALIFIDERTYDGGRLKTYGRTTFDISLPAVPDNTTVALTGRPFGFLVPFFPERGLTFVNTGNLAHGSLMERAVLAHLTRQPVALINREATDGRTALRRAGWAIDPHTCRPVRNNFQTGIELCATTAVALPQP